MKRLVLAALAAAAIAAPAHAAIVTVNFAGTQGYLIQGSGFGPFTQAQEAFIAGIDTYQGINHPSSPYSFTFQYDTAATPVNGKYALTFVSGSVGVHTDFSAFTPYLEFAQAGAYTYMNFFLQRNTLNGGFPIYAAFAIGDNDGDVVAGVLPTSFNNANLDFINASFETYGANQSYRALIDSSSRGLSVVLPGAGAPGAVPEPAAWALMVLGFGGLGAMLRRRRSLEAPALA